MKLNLFSMDKNPKKFSASVDVGNRNLYLVYRLRAVAGQRKSGKSGKSQACVHKFAKVREFL